MQTGAYLIHGKSDVAGELGAAPALQRAYRKLLAPLLHKHNVRARLGLGAQRRLHANGPIGGGGAVEVGEGRVHCVRWTECSRRSAASDAQHPTSAVLNLRVQPARQSGSHTNLREVQGLHNVLVKLGLHLDRLACGRRKSKGMGRTEQSVTLQWARLG